MPHGAHVKKYKNEPPDTRSAAVIRGFVVYCLPAETVKQ
jgi:hypothetical protein